jgi:hypothetical protein
MIFGNTGDIVPSELYGRKLIKLIRGGVATASYHTRLDAGAHGVNDCLADIMELQNVCAFGDEELPTIGRIGDLPAPIEADELCRIIKERLNAPCVTLSGKGTVKKLAVVGGAGKSLVMAAKSAGAKPGWIIRKHLIPNCISVVIISTALQIPSAIFTESYLSFLGLGVNAPMPSLGSLASDALNGINSYPFRLVIPAIVISLIVLSLNLFGDGLRDAFDPKLKH